MEQRLQMGGDEAHWSHRVQIGEKVDLVRDLGSNASRSGCKNRGLNK